MIVILFLCSFFWYDGDTTQSTSELFLQSLDDNNSSQTHSAHFPLPKVHSCQAAWQIILPQKYTHILLHPTRYPCILMEESKMTRLLCSFPPYGVITSFLQRWNLERLYDCFNENTYFCLLIVNWSIFSFSIVQGENRVAITPAIGRTRRRAYPARATTEEVNVDVCNEIHV